MKRLLMILSLFLISGNSVNADVITEDVIYEAGGLSLKGYLAYDDAIDGTRPGILVVHEWWGHNDYARRRAEMLAELGYTALAVDMFGDGRIAAHPDEAGAFAREVMKNLDAGQARFEAGLALLKKHATTDPERIAAIGYCFGGSTVLHMARRGVDIKGAVSFHGSLTTQAPAQAGKVKAKVMVCHGAADIFISQDDIKAFKNELEDAGVEYQFLAYEGAKHSFTNPDADRLAEKFGLEIAYNEAADWKSWEDMKNFFKVLFSE